MAKNRIIYNVQGLFFSPYSGEYKNGDNFYLNGHRILKRVEKVQDFNYSINSNTVELGGFNSKKYIFRGIVGQPEVNFDFSYIPDGVTNENRLNFDVGYFNSGYVGQMFSGLSQNDPLLNNRDFYLVTNKDENDIESARAPIAANIFNPTSVGDIIDSNSKNYNILHLQNCCLNSYEFNIAVGAIPTVRQTYTADNITLHTSGSGVNYYVLDLKSGINQMQNEKIIIPKDLDYYQADMKGAYVLLPTEASVSFYSSNRTGVLFYNDNIQSFNFNLNFNRKNVKSLNYKFPLIKKIEFPINGKVGVSMLVKDTNLSGSFFETINREDDYNIVVLFHSEVDSIQDTKYTFSGCKFDAIEYTSSIENSKIANLNFNFELDPDFNTRGLFVTGNVLRGRISQINKLLIF